MGLGIALLLVVAFTGVGFAASRRGNQDNSKQRSTANAFTSVRSGTLTSNVVARGDIVAQDPVSITAPTGASGGAVLTLLPSPGDSVADGTVLYEANDRPVFALADPIPLYRDLTVGDSGDDVRRLQASLIRIGLLRGRADGVYSRSTAAAIDRLYKSRGYSPPPSPPELDEQLQTLVRQRDELVASSHKNSSPDTSSPDTSSPDNSAAIAKLDQQIADTRARIGTPVRSAEFTVIETLPVLVISVGRSLGDIVSGESPILTIGSSQMTVEIPFLDPGFERFKGRQVKLYVDEESSEPIAATVTGVASRKDESSVLLATAPSLTAAQLGKNIKVVIVENASSEPTLLVPYTALLSATDGTAQVERRSSDGSLTRLDVTVLGEAGGDVSIRPLDPQALHEGDDVRIALP